MKTSLALLVVAGFAAPSLFAEDKPADAPLPTDKPAQVAPQPAGSATELPLIPETPSIDNPKAMPGAKDAGKAKTNKTQTSEDEISLRIRLREAKNKALNDPAVQAEWNKTLNTKTELERREALKRYYKLLYERILKIDGSVKTLATTLQTYALHRLEQTRVDPTEPLDPDQRTERQGRD